MRIQNIEFLRFLFAIIIVLFHGGHASQDGYLAVEMFFILAGYFLACSAEKIKHQTLNEFVLNKWARLWPLFAVAVILAGGNLYDMIFKLLLLHATGLTLKYQGFIWFVAPFFWSMIFYFLILKKYDISKAVLLIIAIIYISYVFIINYDNGNFNIRQTVYAVFPLAILRAIAGVGLGILLVPLFTKIKQLMPLQFTKKTFLIVGMVEGILLFFLVYNMIFHNLKYDNKLIFILFFVFELFLFIERKGFISKFLNKTYFGFMGRYAYAIYIMQALGLKVASKFDLGKKCNIALELAIVTGLGILGYHLIEKPAYTKLLAQKFRHR